MIVQAGHGLLVALMALPPVLFWLRRWRGWSGRRLLAVAAFALYFVGVAAFTIFPLRFDADYLAQEGRARGIIVIAPFFLTPDPVMSNHQFLGNILLGVPFGFGYWFLGVRSLREVLAAGLVFCLSIEAIQLVVSALGIAFPSRTADINDVLLNMIGVTLGALAYLLVRACFRMVPAQHAAAGDGPQ